jgi:hypothetical protein
MANALQKYIEYIINNKSYLHSLCGSDIYYNQLYNDIFASCLLSRNPNITWDFVLKYPQIKWDYVSLSFNHI